MNDTSTIAAQLPKYTHTHLDKFLAIRKLTVE